MLSSDESKNASPLSRGRVVQFSNPFPAHLHFMCSTLMHSYMLMGNLKCWSYLLQVKHLPRWQPQMADRKSDNMKTGKFRTLSLGSWSQGECESNCRTHKFSQETALKCFKQERKLHAHHRPGRWKSCRLQTRIQPRHWRLHWSGSGLLSWGP